MPASSSWAAPCSAQASRGRASSGGTHEPATGGRFFYTEFGHDLRSLSTPFARQHILEGIKWAAEVTPTAQKEN
jgi:hypothetical protein